MQGEYESQHALHELSPSFVPKPIAWDKFAANPRMYFFLCDFIDLTDDIPPPAKFCTELAKLHLQSMKIEKDTPKERFGFHVPTAQGNFVQDNTWCDSWEVFFTRAMKDIIAEEKRVQGSSSEIDELSGNLFDKVIPRLLRPLETDSRRVQPCLIHGDLWHGNTSVGADDDKPYIFDSGSSWAHNECKANMRPI